MSFNSLAAGKFEWNFRYVIFQGISVINDWGISCEFALIWMSVDFPDDQSTLVQVMAWCRQATSHYLSQCWPRSLPPYGVTMPQWVRIKSACIRVKDIHPPAVFTSPLDVTGLNVHTFPLISVYHVYITVLGYWYIPNIRLHVLCSA